MKKITKSRLHGRWQVLCLYVNTSSGWQEFKTFGDADRLWEFGADGTFTETAAGKKVVTAPYTYDPKTGALSFDLPADLPEDAVAAVSSDYHITDIGEDRLSLFDVAEPEQNPDDLSLRQIVIRRI